MLAHTLHSHTLDFHPSPAPTVIVVLDLPTGTKICEGLSLPVTWAPKWMLRATDARMMRLTISPRLYPYDPLLRGRCGIHLRTYFVALKRRLKTSPPKYPQGQTDSSNWRSRSSFLLWSCVCVCPQLDSELCGAVPIVDSLLPLPAWLYGVSLAPSEQSRCLATAY